MYVDIRNIILIKCNVNVAYIYVHVTNLSWLEINSVIYAIVYGVNVIYICLIFKDALILLSVHHLRYWQTVSIYQGKTGMESTGCYCLGRYNGGVMQPKATVYVTRNCICNV